MIAVIKGNIIEREINRVVIDTGNVGYEIKISSKTYSKIKDLQSISLYTLLQIKDDAHVLYGFSEMNEKKAFILLKSVKDVGANTALSILSSLEIKEIINAIVTCNVEIIRAIKGIGPKTAQRIILELKDKISQMVDYKDPTSTNSPISFIKEEAIAALVKLGISKANSEKKISDIIIKEGSNVDVETLVRLALG